MVMNYSVTGVSLWLVTIVSHPSLASALDGDELVFPLQLVAGYYSFSSIVS